MNLKIIIPLFNNVTNKVLTIVFVQNEKVKESSYEFPRSEIYTLGRIESFEVLVDHHGLY